MISPREMVSVPFSTAATGELIAATAGKKISVYALAYTLSLAGTVAFRDGASTIKDGPLACAANGGKAESVNPDNGAFLFQGTLGNALDIVITGGGTATGRLSYFLSR